MPTLTRQRVIMHRSLALNPEPAREFFYEVLDEPGSPRSTQINRADFVNMGSPEVITVTIQPGNRLNS